MRPVNKPKVGDNVTIVLADGSQQLHKIQQNYNGKDSYREAKDDMHLPDRNNTYLSFLYLSGGVIIVNPDLPPLSKTHAEATYNLLGLGKYGNYCNPGG